MAKAIFRFVDYRAFLRDRLQHETAQNGQSFRSIARRCGINSPNYLQCLIAGRRNLTESTARKIADGLGLKGRETDHFLAMVAFASADDEAAREGLKAEMRRLAAAGASAEKKVREPAIHASWLCEVLLEMAYLRGVRFTRDVATARMSGMATPADVGMAFDLLVSLGYLIPADDGAFAPAGISFEPLNDVRIAELRACHSRFLDIAKHRLAADLEQREFQGLTIAVSEAKLALIKERMRAFVASLCDELAHDEDADRVLRIQMGAFRVG